MRKTFYALLLVVFILTSCSKTDDAGNYIGTYELVTIDGNPLPFSPAHEGGAPEVLASTLTLAADGTGKRKLTDHRGIHPTWSPDGSQIAYEGLQREDAGIWITNADGSGDHRISPRGGTAQATAVDDTPTQRRHPDWSN